jgi:hypothetical protein
MICVPFTKKINDVYGKNDYSPSSCDSQKQGKKFVFTTEIQWDTEEHSAAQPQANDAFYLTAKSAKGRERNKRKN